MKRLCGTFLLFAIVTMGCGRDSDRSEVESHLAKGESGLKGGAGLPVETGNHFLDSAKQLFQAGEFEAAGEAASNALLQDPENLEAKLIASEVEAAKGNHRAAADLAASIDVRSRLGLRAIEVQCQQLMKLNRPSDTADAILKGLEKRPDAMQWRHQAWSLLNRVGRREEASLQADVLCRLGHAKREELLSLVRRTDSFPYQLNSDQDPASYFSPGLGMARWYFTQQEYDKALEQLSQEYKSGFQTPASCALYGRLLAETQTLEEFPAWHAKCGSDARKLGDYWAAIGVYFIDQHEYKASAHALLEAVVRNPTDRICVQRLAKVFDAVGRPQEGAWFRHRGIKLTKSMENSEDMLTYPEKLSIPQGLTRKLLELGRPFEAIAWTLELLPPDAVAKRTEMVNKRVALSQNESAIMMPSTMALGGVDPETFSLGPAMKQLRQIATRVASPEHMQAELLAEPRLSNVAVEVGLDFRWVQDLDINWAAIPMHESMGGGIAAFDYDLDGNPDLYLAQGSGAPPTDQCTRSNVLYRNIGAQFIETTSQAEAGDTNYAAGISAGDVNQDGFPDLYLGSIGHNRLLINNGDGTFRDATERMGDVDDRFSSSLAIADINGDALPDLFEANYIEMAGAFVLPKVDPEGTFFVTGPLQFNADSDRWFQNLGDGRFQVHEIPREVAIPGTSLGLMITDIDSNGSNDVFVGNDLRANHLLFQNDEKGFLNVADILGIADGFRGKSNSCMGIASGDFDRDGSLDLFITNYYDEPANLYLQTQGGFTDFATRYGLESMSLPLVGFGTKAVDLDRNGWLDFVVTNGHIFDLQHAGHEFKMPPQLLMSFGNRFEQVEVLDDSGYWDGEYLGRSMASLDFDRDGAIDFIVGHLDQPVALLRNETQSAGNWIQIELIGTTSERDAVGARVTVTIAGQVFTQWVTAGDGYYCSDEPLLDFGLGTGAELDQVQVVWPSGQKQTFHDLELGKRYLIVEGQSEADTR